LARRQEIENLEKEQRAQKLLLEQATGALARCEAGLRAVQEESQVERQRSEKLRGQVHGVQLEVVRLGELVERVKHRTGQIESELAEVQSHEEELRAQREDLETRFQEFDETLAARQEALEAARVAYEAADAAVRTGRETLQRLSAERQRLEYELNGTRSRAQDVAHAITVAENDAERLAADIEAAQLEQAKLDDSAARSGLDDWLAQRSQADEALREERSKLDALAQAQRAIDEQRLTLERDVQPRRDKITELQLKEQAARLAVEQFANQLAEVHADETALAAR
jgi:chromosome segregation protein